MQTYIRCDRVILPRYLGPNVLAIKNNVHFLWKHRALIAINFAQPSSNCEVVDKFVSLFNCVLSLFSHLSILFLSLFYTIHSLPILILCVWMGCVYAICSSCSNLHTSDMINPYRIWTAFRTICLRCLCHLKKRLKNFTRKSIIV